MDGFYSDDSENRDIVDPVKMALYKALLTPVTTLTDYLNAAGDSYATINQSRIADVIQVIKAWDISKGMLGNVSAQGSYVRNWRLSTVSANYLKLKDKFTAEQAAAYTSYIAAYQSVILKKRLYSKNNHKIFEIMGLVLSSMSLGKNYTTYYAELIKHLDGDISNGFIRTENRGFKVRGYHNFYMKAALTTLYVHKLRTNEIPKNSTMETINLVLARLEANDIQPYKLNFNYTTDPSLDANYEKAYPTAARTIYKNLVFGAPLPTTKIDYMENLAAIRNP